MNENDATDNELATIAYVLRRHAAGATPEAIAMQLAQRTVIAYDDLLDLVNGIIAASNKEK